MEDKQLDVKKLVERLGGTNAVARMFRIKPPSVAWWKKSNKLPDSRLLYVELKHPDVLKDCYKKVCDAA